MKRLNKMKWYLIAFLCCPFHAYADNFLLGVNTHPQSFPGGANSFIKYIRVTDVNSIRTDYPWYQVEKRKGKYSTPDKNIEQSISLAINNNIRPVLILGYGNALYTKKSTVNPRMKPIGDKAVSAYINYATWTAKHFDNKHIVYEIWNEWVQGGGGDKKITLSKASMNSYSNIINKTCNAIKKVDKTSTVIFGSTSPFDNKSNLWLKGLFSMINMECIDGISFHAYHYYPQRKQINADSVVNKLDELQQSLQKINKDGKYIPFYITEIGVPSITRAKYNEYDIRDYFNKLIPLLISKKYIKGV